jgi:ketosteroid isomerase-like protein
MTTRTVPAWLAGLFLGLLLAVPNATAQSAPDDASQVERLERELVRAIGAKDLESYDRIVAPDYVVVTAAGPETSKAQVMDQYRSGERGYTDLAIDEVKVHVFGDTAVVTARTLGSRQEHGTSTPNRVRYLRVYARRGGRWQAVTQMSAPLPAP